jgi:hypothetical protein
MPSAFKREHPVLKNMKILDFFLFLWIIFALLDPDPATKINADPDPNPCSVRKPACDLKFADFPASCERRTLEKIDYP